MNTIIVTGNLGAKAVEREKDGRKYIAFRIGTNTTRGTEKKTTWRSVFYHYSEGLFARLEKGAAVLVMGDEEISLYNGKNGAQIDIVVNANKVQVISDAPQAKQPQVAEPPIAKNEQMFDDFNDDKPF